MTSLADIPGEARCKQLVHQLLTKQTTCQGCSGKLAWKRNRDYGWCRACRKKIRPKAVTWFRGSKLSYRQLFLLLYCWQKRHSPGTARLATGLSYTTIRRWYWRFRSIVPKDDQKAMLSGVVEVDEAWFGRKRHGNQTIVVGGVERDTGRLKLQIIPDTEQDSLEGFLETHVARDSLVVTDCAAGYQDIQWLGYSMKAGTIPKDTSPAPTTLSRFGVP